MIDKTNKIHPSAILDGNIEIGCHNEIGANCVFRGNICIGDHNIFGPGCTFKNNVMIGNDNNFEGQCSIGGLGEMGTKGDKFLENGAVLLGDHNKFREFVTINSPVRKESTRIGNHCYFMARTHIPHDCIVEDRVVMATNSLIGGGSKVHKFAYIGLGSVTHQWVDIGESAMVGLQAGVTNNVPPFATVIGVPAKILKVNRVGAERRGFLTEHIDEVEEHYREILCLKYDSDNEMVKIIREFLPNYENFLTKFAQE